MDGTEVHGRRTGTAARVVVAAVFVEALVLLGYGVFLAYETVAEQPLDRVGAAFLAVIVVLFGGALLGCARAVLRRRPEARVPLLLWQVLQVTVAVPAVQQPDGLSRWGIGVPLIVLAVVVGAGMLHPAVLGPLSGPAGPPSED
jgi:hypothetical protein